MELSCTICSEQYEPSAHVVITPCGHKFHNDCILPWLERSTTCPECRSTCVATELIKINLDDIKQSETSTTLQTLDNWDIIMLKLNDQEAALREIEKRSEEQQIIMGDTLQILYSQAAVLKEIEKRSEEQQIVVGDTLQLLLDEISKQSAAMSVLEEKLTQVFG